MKFSLPTAIAILSGLALSAPTPHNSATNAGANAVSAASSSSGNTATSGSSIIAQLQGTFDRNNPNGTPTSAGNPDDLNGDGVINAFEAGAQVS
jgi:hypothetical protein